MLTKRTLLLTAPGLLMGYLAAAQNPSAGAASTGSDILFWVLVGILAIVGLMVIVTGASVAAVARLPHGSSAASSDQTATSEKGNTVC